MPNSRSRRTTPSRQERQALQREARQMAASKRQRRGLKYVMSVGIVGVLVVFGVTNLAARNDDDGGRSGTTAVTSVTGQASCPRADGRSERRVFFEVAPGRCIDSTKVYVATIETTAGNITAEIYPAKAFNAANNFVYLARYHFYDGLPIHRVLKDTFIQTGDPVAPNVSGPGYVFPDDGLPESSAEYVRGALVFAHEAKDLNGSQFLIVTGPQMQTLKPTFPLFGQVKRGLAVLDKINSTATDDPNTQQIRYSIISISVTEKVTERD